MTDYAAEKLGLEGKLQPFVLKGVTDAENNLMSPRVDAEVASLDGSFKQLLKGIQVIPVITDDTKALDWRPILSTYGIEGVPPAREGQIDLQLHRLSSHGWPRDENRSTVVVDSDFTTVKCP